MKKNNHKKGFVTTKTTNQLAKALELESTADIALMEYKARLSEMAMLAIEDSELTVNEIVKRSGVARSKVSAIKNGAVAGISCDLYIKVIAAAGAKLTFKMAS